MIARILARVVKFAQGAMLQSQTCLNLERVSLLAINLIAMAAYLYE